MNIIEIDGKDYLETFIGKLDNEHIDATPFFVESQECLNKIVKAFNREHKTHFSYLDKGQYGGNLQSTINRFSGNYFSASFMKSYTTNPATCLYNTFCKEEKTDATAIGSTVHKILEEYYKLPGEKRTEENMWKLYHEHSDLDKVKQYIEGYLQTPDYLGEERNDKELNCVCEFAGRNKLYIPKFKLELPECAYVIDRIDFRDNKTYIIDYKTGTVNANSLTFDGNLGQMILYKWVIEQEFGKPVEDVYICAPGNKEYLKVDCSEENQKILINKINEFFKKFKLDNQTRIYKYTDKGYFTNNDMREFRQIMNNDSIQMAKIPVRIYIGEHEERLI